MAGFTLHRVSGVLAAALMVACLADGTTVAETVLNPRLSCGFWLAATVNPRSACAMALASPPRKSSST